MNNQDYYRISPVEMSVTLIAMLLAIGVLTLPRTLAETLDTGDGWISVLVSGFLVMGLVYLIVNLQKQFPGQNLLEFIGDKRVGKVVAKLLGLMFVLYFIPYLAYEARVLTIIVRMYLLDRTPPEITIAIILLTTTYAVTKGVQGIVHLNLMFVPFILFVYFILMIFNLENMSFTEIRPVLPKGVMSLVPSLEPTMFSYLGIELLFFWLAYTKTSNLRALPLNIGIFFVTLLYVMIVLVSYMTLSVTGAMNTVFPTVALAKEVEIVEGLIERFEPIMIVIWIMAIFNTMTIIQILAVQIIKKELFNVKKETWVLAAVMFLTYITAFIPNSNQEVFTMGDWVSYAGASLIVLSLMIGYLKVWLQKVGKKSQQRGKEIAK
ncbi:GerAB/ArcD/ProY family transporter [Halalkalibacter okhensis]|uniref:GerAB/ArcD/ProY family transporter n=1 Tax=Halalkalibacter okhensis TaxID=333138 RepID=UPI0008A84A66|nr:GerAB/ArcD/ProY family transporter [Halalkalibacter okhensis]